MSLWLQIFSGNKDQDTWKRHCLHKYYGYPPKTRYIRFVPQVYHESIALRIELYGFRGKLLDNTQKVNPLLHMVQRGQSSSVGLVLSRSLVQFPAILALALWSVLGQGSYSILPQSTQQKNGYLAFIRQCLELVRYMLPAALEYPLGD